MIPLAPIQRMRTFSPTFCPAFFIFYAAVMASSMTPGCSASEELRPQGDTGDGGTAGLPMPASRGSVGMCMGIGGQGMGDSSLGAMNGFAGQGMGDSSIHDTGSTGLVVPAGCPRPDPQPVNGQE